jgi:hypothetical protein
MKDFLFLEGAYIILGLIILSIAVFVSTRSFMPKGSLKKGLFWTTSVVALFILSHYYITTTRMQKVKDAFYNGKEILCENRIYTKAAQFITIKDNGDWKIENNNFISPHYERAFFLARCIVK